MPDINYDETSTKALFESYKEVWSKNPPMDSERVNGNGWPILYDDTKAFIFRKDFDEDDVRFKRLMHRELKFAWSYGPNENKFRMTATYGVFSYSLPWITDGVQ